MSSEDAAGKYYIGLMSGTSIDSIDAVLIDFASGRPELIASHSEDIPEDIRQFLHQLCQPSKNELSLYARMDASCGYLFATAVKNLLRQTSIKPESITAIGSHGQTIRHFPEPSVKQSLQIGDPNIIAESTGITTVADFRRRDMAAGGEGAPLVPAFHQSLFHSEQRHRCILNIGGIANVSILNKDHSIATTGFDTGPGNTLIDAWTQQQLHKKMDEGGNWAASGHLNESLLADLLEEDYFKLAAPKSTGRERFNLNWLENILTNHPLVSPVDIANTLVEFTATSISKAIQVWAENTEEVYVCGGGIHNHFLMKRLQAHMPGCPIFNTSILGVDPDLVEAIAFAWLARQTISGVAGNLPAVTGASHEVILGGIYPG